LCFCVCVYFSGEIRADLFAQDFVEEGDRTMQSIAGIPLVHPGCSEFPDMKLPTEHCAKITEIDIDTERDREDAGPKPYRQRLKARSVQIKTVSDTLVLETEMEHEPVRAGGLPEVPVRVHEGSAQVREQERSGKNCRLGFGSAEQFLEGSP